VSPLCSYWQLKYLACSDDVPYSPMTTFTTNNLITLPELKPHSWYQYRITVLYISDLRSVPYNASFVTLESGRLDFYIVSVCHWVFIEGIKMILYQ